MSIEFNNELISKSIPKLYLDRASADVEFIFEEDAGVIPAHKAILASASPVFYTMFFGSLKEGDAVKITDTSIEVFMEFIKFFYMPNVTVSLENLEEVLRLADKYDVPDHLKSYVNLIKNQLTEENMIWGYKIASSLGNDELKQFCEEKISQSVNIFKSEAVLKIEQPHLKRILMMDRLACKEIDIFNGCIKWATDSCINNNLDANNPKMLRKQLDDSFQLIRFAAMERKDLGEIMKDNLYAGLFTPDEMLDLMRVLTVENFKSSKFNQSTRQKYSFNNARMNRWCCICNKPALNNSNLCLECLLYEKISR